MSDPKTYINIPVSEADEKRIYANDKRWTGPRLILLTACTLTAAFIVLFMASQHMIGPSMPEETLAPGALTGH